MTRVHTANTGVSPRHSWIWANLLHVWGETGLQYKNSWLLYTAYQNCDNRFKKLFRICIWLLFDDSNCSLLQSDCLCFCLKGLTVKQHIERTKAAVLWTFCASAARTIDTGQPKDTWCSLGKTPQLFHKLLFCVIYKILNKEIVLRICTQKKSDILGSVCVLIWIILQCCSCWRICDDCND